MSDIVENFTENTEGKLESSGQAMPENLFAQVPKTPVEPAEGGVTTGSTGSTSVTSGTAIPKFVPLTGRLNLITRDQSPVPEAVPAPLTPAQLEEAAEKAQRASLPPVHVIYVPGPGVPSHLPMLFGRPYEISLQPNISTELPGWIAAALANDFPRTIFLDDGNGNPITFPNHPSPKKN